MQLINSVVTVPILLYIQSVKGQALPSVIASCADVDCPDSDNGGGSKCTIADKTFSAIGLSSIPTTSEQLSGLTWTQGVRTNDTWVKGTDGKDQGQRTFEKAFYLGTPPSKNLTDVSACAVFFNELKDDVDFPVSRNGISKGTCQEALTTECVDALTKRALGVDLSGLSNVDACKKLQTAFTDNMDAACTSKTQTGKWREVTVTTLTGPGANLPISSSQNATSNCWPILPKQNNLTPESSTSTVGDFTSSIASKRLFSITPILTLFYPGNGSFISKPEASMTCLKAISFSEAENKTINGSDKPKSDASAFATATIGILIPFTLLSVLLL